MYLKLLLQKQFVVSEAPIVSYGVICTNVREACLKKNDILSSDY